MQPKWIDRPAVYRKVFFSLIAFLFAASFLFGSVVSGIATNQESVVRALYQTAAAFAFLAGLVPWIRVERD